MNLLITHGLPKLFGSYVYSALGFSGHINNAPAVASLALKVLGLLTDGVMMLAQHTLARRKFVSIKQRIELEIFNRLYTSQAEFEQEKKRIETEYERSLLPLFNTMVAIQKAHNNPANASNSIRKPLFERLKLIEGQVSEVNRKFEKDLAYTQGQLDAIENQICQLLGIPNPNDPIFKNPLLRGIVILRRDAELIDGG